MTLCTIYQENDKVVYGTFAEGNAHYFYSGFASTEEAKKTTFDSLLESKLGYCLAVNEHCGYDLMPTSIAILKEEVEVALIGEWSEIQ
jgi:hypothetical protein